MYKAILFSVLLVLTGTMTEAVCQNAENRSLFPRTPSDRCMDAENVCEQLFKLRVAHNKKEHEEMVSRAEEALKLSEELENSIASNSRLSEREIEKLQTFEKLLKKIRSELGARDLDDSRSDANQDEYDDEPSAKVPADVISGFKVLRENTLKLVSEIRKSTRFTISAAAIQTSNAILKLSRVLRFWQ